MTKETDLTLVDSKKRTWFQMTTNPKLIEMVTELKKGLSQSNPELGANMNQLNETIKIVKKKMDQNMDYSKFDKNGFLITSSVNKAQFMNDSSQNSPKEIDRALKWNTLIKTWPVAIKKNNKKVYFAFFSLAYFLILHSQIKSLCEKGIPARVRGEVWKLLTQSTPEYLSLRTPEIYKESLKGVTEHEIQIQKDIKRTFPENILLMKKGG